MLAQQFQVIYCFTLYTFVSYYYWKMQRDNEGKVISIVPAHNNMNYSY